MTATTTPQNRSLSHIPVKEGCTRVYVGSWAWTESNGYATEEDAENAIHKEYRRPNFGSIYALDVPTILLFSPEYASQLGYIYRPSFPHYLSYKVGERPAGVTEQVWEG